jgi:simple sugar transport system permease protein
MSPVVELLFGAIALGTTLLLPALGELIGERSGIINLGTEGGMLAGAFSAVIVTLITGHLWVGILAGVGAGAVCGLVHATVVVVFHANQLAAGLVLWFLVLGVTSVLGKPYYGQVIDPLPDRPVPLLAQIPAVGPVLFDHNVLAYVGYALVPGVWWFLYRTRMGLVIRATGERPHVVAAAGLRPGFARVLAVTAGGALAGLGGVSFTAGGVGNWSNGITSGYGFIAVAVVSFANWSPIGVMAGSYLFGFAIAAQPFVQTHGVPINQYLLDAFPYLLTVLALVLVSARGRAWGPESLRRAIGSAT